MSYQIAYLCYNNISANSSNLPPLYTNLNELVQYMHDSIYTGFLFCGNRVAPVVPMISLVVHSIQERFRCSPNCRLNNKQISNF